MSQRPRTIPVGILVSVSESRRRKRRFRRLADYPPIKKEVNLPLRIGLCAGGGVLALLAVLGMVWGCAKARSTPPIALVKQAPLVRGPVAQAPQIVEPPAQPVNWEHPVARIAVPQRLKPEAAPPQQAAAVDVPSVASQPPACSNLGTQITFLSHPPEAFQQAAREKKLVLMIHLSGNFEDQAFT